MTLLRHVIEPQHEAGARFYPTPLGRLPSVTTILDKTANKPELREWSKQVGVSEALRRTQEAVQRGRSFHHEMEEFLSQGQAGASAYFRSVGPFLSRMSPAALVEGTVWHRDGFAGTVDCVALVDGVLSVIDWKTTSRKKASDAISDERLQVAAYRAALQALYGVEVKKGFLVFALPDQMAHVVEVEDLEGRYQAFLSRLQRCRFPAIGDAAPAVSHLPTP